MTRPRPSFDSSLASEIERFLEHKRALGRRYENEEHALRLFDRYLVEHGTDAAEAATAAVIEAFLASRPRARARSFNHLLGVIRRLFEWMVVQGDIDRTPPCPRPRRATSHRIPFLLDLETARRLLQLAGGLPDWPRARLRGPTYRTIYGLLYGLGLRVGEVTRLTGNDVDGERCLLVIRRTKFSKTRLVPYGPRMERFIGRYLAQRRELRGPLLDSAPVFSFGDGRPINRGSIGRVFRALVRELGLVGSDSCGAPCVHDLRHSFAVGTLLRWYRQGLNPSSRLLHLSTFLGHVHPDSTAVYLTITEELLRQAGGRFERYATSMFEEVSP